MIQLCQKCGHQVEKPRTMTWKMVCRRCQKDLHKINGAKWRAKNRLLKLNKV